MRRYPRSRLQLLDPVKRKTRSAQSDNKNDSSSSNIFDQSSYASDNIKRQMQYHGIYVRLEPSTVDILWSSVSNQVKEDVVTSNARLQIVPRMNKEGHIRRQSSDSDLFLDTVVYGAHSTATDALRAVGV